VVDHTVTSALSLYRLPLFELLYQAHSVHREHKQDVDIQQCALLSIKTGGCPEDCGYCSQSAHHKVGLQREPLLSVTEVREAAVQC
jgi:biotin synthase